MLVELYNQLKASLTFSFYNFSIKILNEIILFIIYLIKLKCKG